MESVDIFLKIITLKNPKNGMSFVVPSSVFQYKLRSGIRYETGEIVWDMF